MSPDVFGYIAAALMAGLWWGERGRRIAAERMLETGVPTTRAAISVDRAKDAEDRVTEENRQYSEDTIERVFKDLKAQAKAEGYEISDDQLRADAERMLAGDNVET